MIKDFHNAEPSGKAVARFRLITAHVAPYRPGRGLDFTNRRSLVTTPPTPAHKEIPQSEKARRGPEPQPKRAGRPRKKTTGPAVCLVLDKSGSMEGMAGQALTAVNNYISAAKADKNLRKGTLSILLFDSASLEWIRKTVPMAKIELVTDKEYIPHGLTPLYDAIGAGIDHLGDAEKAVLVIMTDGHENDSKTYNLPQIRDRIEVAKNKGWLVLFLGANLSVAGQGAVMGMGPNSVAAYAGAPGLRASGIALCQTLSNYAAAQSFDELLVASSAGWTAQARALMSDANRPVRSRGRDHK